MTAAAPVLLAAAMVALLARIAINDFRIQRITNNDVMALASVGLLGQLLAANAAGSWWPLGMAAALGIVLFAVLLPFWLARKVGAGDVKLLAVTPLVAGAPGMLAFSVLLLVFAAMMVVVVKNPLLLPSPLFRQYIAHLDRKRVVPFGVPIAAALIVVVLLTAGRQLAGRGF